MGAKVDVNEVEIPPEVNYLYETFKNIKFSRVPNGESFALVSKGDLGYNEINYYSKASGINFELWEVEAMLSLNAIFERSVN